MSFDQGMIEQLVKKKPTMRDMIVQSGIVFITVLLLLIFFVFGWVFVMIPVVFGIVAASAFLFTRMNLEYEYTLLEHDLTIDCIRNRSGRRLVVWADVKSFDAFGQVVHPQFEHWKNKVQKVYDARGDSAAQDAWFAVFPDQKGGGKNLLLFQPNQKLLSGLLTQVPQTIVLKVKINEN